jgi:hypothetical protein
MRSQRTGNVYLAGLVIAAAVLHCAILIVSTALTWVHADRSLLIFKLVVLGVVPAILAISLALRASSETGEASAARSGGGLVILLAALALSHVRGGAF